MPINTINDWVAMRDAPTRSWKFAKDTPAPVEPGRWQSLWTEAPNAGSVPIAVGVIPTNDTAGSLEVSEGSEDILARTHWNGLDPGVDGVLWVCRRLIHFGGLDGTDTSSQPVSIGAAGVERAWAALEVYSDIGATPTTATFEYTDDISGGLTSPEFPVGGNLRFAGTFYPLPLLGQSRFVVGFANITLNASTGTAGDFGITLFRPLFMMPRSALGDPTVDHLVGGGCNTPVIDSVPDSLFLVFTASGGGASRVVGQIDLIEGN